MDLVMDWIKWAEKVGSINGIGSQILCDNDEWAEGMMWNKGDGP